MSEKNGNDADAYQDVIAGFGVDPSGEDEESAREPEQSAAEPEETAAEPEGGDPAAALEAANAKIAELERARSGLIGELQEVRKVAQRTTELEKLIEERLPPKAEPAEEVPDPDVDPARYAAYKAEATEKKLDAVLERQQKGDEKRQQKEQLEALQNWMAATERAYEVEHPDYEAAEEHWTNGFTENVKLMNPNATQEEIDQLIVRAEVTMALQARQRGSTLPDLKMKQARIWGWKPPESEAKPAAEDDGVEVELPPPSGPRTKKLQKAKSLELVGGGGKAKGGKVSLKARLAAADQDEYNAIMADLEARLGSPRAAMAYVQREGVA